jgi:hypothetical protein
MENRLRIPIVLTATRRVYSTDVPQINGRIALRLNLFSRAKATLNTCVAGQSLRMAAPA